MNTARTGPGTPAYAPVNRSISVISHTSVMASSGGMVWWMSAVRNTCSSARPTPQTMNGSTHARTSTTTTQVTTVIAGLVANRPSTKPVRTISGNTKTAAIRATIAPNGFAARRSRSRRADGAVSASRTPTTTGNVTDSTSTLFHDWSRRSSATSRRELPTL